MSADGGWRRVLPAPRRRPGLLAVLIRWRVEIVIAAVAIAVGVRLDGPVAIGLGVLLIVTAAVPRARHEAIGLYQAVVVPHRLRSALVQGGITDRRGSPPRIMWARPVDDSIRVRVWLRSGTTIGDLEESVPLIASACGAADVQVVQQSSRQDQATVVVVRPRWGLLGA